LRGPAGIRAGWRVVVFFALWLGCYFVLLLAAFALGLPSVGGMWDPARFLPMEAINLASVVVATLVIARLERRALLAAFSTCGLPLPAARSHFGEGVVWGATAMTALIGGIAALGGYTPTSLNAIGGELVAPLLVWVVGFAMLGVAEELLFRAYPLFTLRRAIGFWPAAFVLSVFFSAFHAGKDGETWVDLLGLVLFGLFAAFTVWRTGSVWFAIGFHAAFNFFGLVVYSAPNGGELLPGRLLADQFSGPDWLTGGSLGPEASALAFPLFAALFVLFGLRQPRISKGAGTKWPARN
jgi:membrane protease YdiL (CAAX protease family)